MRIFLPECFLCWLSIVYVHVDGLHPEVNEYHACLDQSLKEAGITGTNQQKGRSVIVETGKTVALPCYSCLDPGKDPEELRSSITWEMRSALMLTLGAVPLNTDAEEDEGDEGFWLEEDGTLSVRSATNEEIGEYFCRDVGDALKPPISIYRLDVVEKISEQEVSGPNDGTISYIVGAEEEMLLRKLGVDLVWDWSDWSGCDTCDEIGAEYRTADCHFVKSNKVQWEQLDDWLFFLFNYYGKLSCLSALMPQSIRNLPVVKKGPHRLQHIRRCYKKCSTPFYTEQSSGSPKTYDSPPIPVKRRTKNTYEAKRYLVISCTGTRMKSSMAYYWKKGAIALSRKKLNRLYHDRVKLDTEYNIVISPVTTEDNGTYSCWSPSGRLIMTLNLVVRATAKTQLIQSVLLLVVELIIIVLLTNVCLGKCFRDIKSAIDILRSGSGTEKDDGNDNGA